MFGPRGLNLNLPKFTKNYSREAILNRVTMYVPRNFSPVLQQSFLEKKLSDIFLLGKDSNDKLDTYRPFLYFQ